MPKRDPLPDDIKELIELCRAGKLFAVQKWIESGKRFRLPPGNFSISPLLSALQTGFHSMVEVLLRAGVDQEEMNSALWQAVSIRRLDLFELLVSHGADHTTIDFDDLLAERNLAVTRWYIKNGMDMEKGFPIARGLRDRQREFLGIYMGLRDTVPSARRQAAMALRIHCREGNMKWVSLLLWADADPRAIVPDLEHGPDLPECEGTALVDAVRRANVAVVKKIGLDPNVDDLTALLGECFFRTDPELVRLLLEAGANPNGGSGDQNPMQALIRNFEWSIESGFCSQKPDSAIRCLEMAASFGGRWRPSCSYAWRTLRQSLRQAPRYTVLSYLERIVKSGAIERETFRELMNTSRMKEVIDSCGPGSLFLRDFAGQKKRPRKIAAMIR